MTNHKHDSATREAVEPHNVSKELGEFRARQEYLCQLARLGETMATIIITGDPGSDCLSVPCAVNLPPQPGELSSATLTNSVPNWPCPFLKGTDVQNILASLFPPLFFLDRRLGSWVHINPTSVKRILDADGAPDGPASVPSASPLLDDISTVLQETLPGVVALPWTCVELLTAVTELKLCQFVSALVKCKSISVRPAFADQQPASSPFADFRSSSFQPIINQPGQPTPSQQNRAIDRSRVITIDDILAHVDTLPGLSRTQRDRLRRRCVYAKWTSVQQSSEEPLTNSGIWLN